MKNVKVIAGFSVFGFLLSFLFGLFSRSGFFRVLLSAFLFAVVFAAMGFIVQYVFKNVLDMGMDSEDAGISETPSSVGQHVDITVEEEDIPESGDDSHFMVGTNLQMLNESDYGSGGKEVKEEPSINSSSAEGAKIEMKAEEKPSVSDEKKNTEGDEKNSARSKIAFENEAGSSSSSFVPVALAQAEQKTDVSVEPEMPPSVESGAETKAEPSPSEELDTLPELEEITAFTPKISQESFEEKESEDSGGTSAPKLEASEIAEGKDVSLMAKAISTLLSKDS